MSIKIINSKEVCNMCGFSSRHLQYITHGRDGKNKNLPKEEQNIIPFYKVENGWFFYKSTNLRVPVEFCRSKIVFIRKEVVRWYNKTYETQIK